MAVHLISYLRAAHIVFLIAMFSGLFFLGRMFIYHAEAEEKSAAERDAIQAFTKKAVRRVWSIIVLPSTFITLLIGIVMMVKLGSMKEPWFHFKLTLLIFFFGYIHACGKFKKRVLTGSKPLKNTIGLRLFNELPFLFAAAITFTVIPRSFKPGLAVLVAMLLVFAGVWFGYKRCKKS